MKTIILLVCLLMPCHAWAFNPFIVCSGSQETCTVTETPETTCDDGIDNDCDGLVDGADSDCATAEPVWAAGLNDDAASTVVTASIGSNGVIYPSDADGYTNTLQNDTALTEGAGSFTFSQNDQTVSSPTLNSASFEDGIFTVQFTLYFDSSETFTGSGFYPRLIATANGTELLCHINNSDTSILCYYDGTAQTALTINDITSSSNHVLRIVFNKGTTPELAVYQGATEGALALVDSNATLGGSAAPTLTSLIVKFGGDGTTNKSIGLLSTNKIDDLKIWDTAVIP